MRIGAQTFDAPEKFFIERVDQGTLPNNLLIVHEMIVLIHFRYSTFMIRKLYKYNLASKGR